MSTAAAAAPARREVVCVRLCYDCSYGCCISQERINTSAAPTAPGVFFQLSRLHLVYHGFNKQCGQYERWDNWHSTQGKSAIQRGFKNDLILILCACMLSRFIHVQLFVTLWTVAHQAPLSRGYSRQEHWCRFLCPPPRELHNPRIKPTSLISPALAGGFLPLTPLGKPNVDSTYN